MNGSQDANDRLITAQLQGRWAKLAWEPIGRALTQNWAFRGFPTQARTRHLPSQSPMVTPETESASSSSRLLQARHDVLGRPNVSGPFLRETVW